MSGLGIDTARPHARALRRTLSQPTAVVGLLLLIALVVMASVGPRWYGVSPDVHHLDARLQGPSATYPFGTDQFGRDVLARCLAGAGRSLSAAGLVLGATLVLGLVTGVSAAMVGGVVDAAICRALDILLAFPPIVLTLALIGLFGAGFGNLVLALVLAAWADDARYARALALTARHRPDVHIAHLMGVPRWRNVLGHVVPGVVVHMLVKATVGMGGVIVAISGLSFLGLGVQPPDAEWGSMLAASQTFFVIAPWLLLAPAGCLFATIASATLLSDAVRDGVDPGSAVSAVRS